jgi:hypothetical protein
MKRTFIQSIGGLAFLLAVGCGGGGASSEGGRTPGKSNVGGKEVTTGVQPGGEAVKKEAADAFTTAANEFKKHEESRDWDDATCASVAASFVSAGKAQGGKFPAAHYNAGVALTKCGKDEQAQAEFELALNEAADLANASSDPKVKNDPVFHQVWVQKALVRYRRGDVPGISEAIDIIFNKGFDTDGSRNVEAFVNLGMLYRERWNRDLSNPERTKKDKFNLEDDLNRAQFWLQNALAINDAFMPAYNQLALFYLDKARDVGVKEWKRPKYGDERKKALLQKGPKSDLQTLELGLLVASEASRRDPSYAGIWNTQGLILLDLGRTGAATAAFKTATEKDPKFFEAWMNYAAINLQFRSYAEAERGYKAATGLHTKDYDAKLGLAIALRGQLDYHLTRKGEYEGKGMSSEAATENKAFIDSYNGAKKAYEDAKALDPSRAEGFFDYALLVEKYKANAESKNVADTYEEAEKLFAEVAAKFASQPKYDKLAKDAQARSDEDRKAKEFARTPVSMPSAPAASSATPAAAGSASAAPAASAGPAASASAAKTP